MPDSIPDLVCHHCLKAFCEQFSICTLSAVFESSRSLNWDCGSSGFEKQAHPSQLFRNIFTLLAEFYVE